MPIGDVPPLRNRRYVVTHNIDRRYIASHYQEIRDRRYRYQIFQISYPRAEYNGYQDDRHVLMDA